MDNTGVLEVALISNLLESIPNSPVCFLEYSEPAWIPGPLNTASIAELIAASATDIVASLYFFDVDETLAALPK